MFHLKKEEKKRNIFVLIKNKGLIDNLLNEMSRPDISPVYSLHG